MKRQMQEIGADTGQLPSRCAFSVDVEPQSNLLHELETIMARKFIDCREYPSDMNCTVAISADSDKELLEIAVDHAVKAHGHKDTPELRQQLSKMFKHGVPPA